MRVLMLVPYPAIEGPLPKLVPLLVEQLRRLGCDIETENWSRHSDHESLLDKVLGRSGDLLRVHARLTSRRFDVLFIVTAHTWAGLARDIPLVLATRRACPRRVIQFHGSYSDRLISSGNLLFKWASRVLVGRCDATLVLSGQERSEWSRFYPPGRFELVANPFTPEMVGGTSARPAGGGPGDVRSTRERYRSGVPTLLFVGRLIPEKGILDLVRAVATVSAATPCRLLVAGDGLIASVVSRTANELGIGGNVAMLGYVSGADLAYCYHEADALVLPTYWAEGFPTVLLEAMSAGLPIITTKLRGAADWLDEGVNTLFVPPQRPDVLAEAIARVLADDRLRISMGDNNLTKVREFSPEIVATRYMSILESVVEKDTAHGTTAEG